MAKSKKIFYLLLFLFPINLGKHFEVSFSFVNGILIDYLVPTIYIQDILILVLLFTYFFENIKTDLKNISLTLKISFKKILNQKDLYIFYLFIFSSFLSALNSNYSLFSLFIFGKTFLYFLLFLYIYYNFNFNKEFSNLTKVLIFSMSFVCILGILQFLKQGSIFNNYLILGEQPYFLGTKNILIENVLGFSVVPPYGLFKHPNVFGGILSILIIYIINLAKKTKYYYFLLFLFLLTLVFTFSIVSFISLILGLVLYLFKNYLFRIKRIYVVFVFIFLVLFSIIIFDNNFILINNNDDSLINRKVLNTSSLNMVKHNLSYGVGNGLFTFYLNDYLTNKSIKSVSFIQPVHNIYLLLLSELGIVSFIFFIYFLIKTIFKTNNVIIFISLVQLLFIGMFDHYILTIHQTNLLFFIIISLCFTTYNQLNYNKNNE